jgi:hypothetical protein
LKYMVGVGRFELPTPCSRKNGTFCMFLRISDFFEGLRLFVSDYCAYFRTIAGLSFGL